LRYFSSSAIAASGDPGSVTTTMRRAASIPASAKALAYARRCESVSTVPPDLLDTTRTVRSSWSAMAALTCPGSVVSSVTSSTPAVAQITSGARELPPIPARTTWSTFSSASSARSVSMSATSGRDDSARRTQDSRIEDSASAAGPHSVGSWAVILLATWSAISMRTAPT
jgi:hypothetical protein